MTTIFSENLKKFRLQKKLTQEEAAAVLGVSTQSISRWECSAALPDVLRLPEIAKLYGVSVDDFYKKTNTSYDNYAQRLGAIYNHTRKPADFLIAHEEFEKRKRNNEYTDKDMLWHAHIHQSMMIYCNRMANELFDAVIEKNTKDRIYWEARHHKNNHRMFIGETEECIKEQIEIFKKDLNNYDEFQTLIITYFLAGKYEEGYECYMNNNERFEIGKYLLILAGNLATGLMRFDEAISYYKRAEVLDDNNPKLYLAWARAYETMGDIEKAVEMYRKSSELFAAEGYDIEAQKVISLI